MKYEFLAGFFFHDVRLLQGISLLRCFSYIHPNLVLQHWKRLRGISDSVARALLEKYFRIRADEFVTDDFLKQLAVNLITRHKSNHESSVSLAVGDVLQAVEPEQITVQDQHGEADAWVLKPDDWAEVTEVHLRDIAASHLGHGRDTERERGPTQRKG